MLNSNPTSFTPLPKAIEKALQAWLEKEPKDATYLLGYSGGGDSKALLYALLALRPDISLIVLHINHRWRPSSDEEEISIKKEIHNLNLVCHTEKIPTEPTSNLEEHARHARYCFFQKMQKRYQTRGVLLAHHKQDLAETILKRWFEGSSLNRLFGMQESSMWEDVPIFRPLLQVEKSVLTQFVESRGLSYVDDETNQDPRFLRARLRNALFPLLETHFGKSIGSNLVCLANDAQEFSQDLEIRYRAFQEKIYEGPFGVCLYQLDQESRAAQRFFLQEEARKQQISLRRSWIDTLLSWLDEKKSGASLPFQESAFYVYRGSVFFLKKTTFFPPEMQPVIGEKTAIKLKRQEQEKNGVSNQAAWLKPFMGKADYFVPKEKTLFFPITPFLLFSSDQDLSFLQHLEKSKSQVHVLQKMWAKEHIPLFLRRHLLLLISADGAVHHPLQKSDFQENSCTVSIDLHQFYGYFQKSLPRISPFLL